MRSVVLATALLFHASADDAFQDQVGFLARVNATCLLPVQESAKPGEAPFVQQLVAVLLDFARQHGMASCGNWSAEQVAQRCGQAAPGDFCIRGTIADGRSCVLGGPDGVAHLPCPAGLYCPGGAAEPVVCRKGYHCPERAVAESPCPTGSFCPVAGLRIRCSANSSDLLRGAQCLPSRSGPAKGRTMLPLPCEAGSYCTEGVPQTCPQGYFCPMGVASPSACSITEYCPPGTAKPRRMVRSAAEFVSTTSVFGLMTWSLRCWCLKPRLWWLRLLMAFGALAALWAWEMVRPSPWSAPPLFATFTLGTIAVGAYLDRPVQKMVGALPGQALQLALGCALVMACMTMVRDPAAGVFVAMLVPAVIIIKAVCVNDMPDQHKILLLLLGCVLALVASLKISSGARERALFYAIFAPIAVLSRAFTAWLRVLQASRRQRAGAVPRETDAPAATLRAQLRGSETMPALLPSAAAGAAAVGAAAVGTAAPDGPARAASFPVECMELEAGAHPGGGAGIGGGRPGIGFRLDSVSLVLPGQRVILDSISLAISAGSAVAVMGPSGCGKSSITNVLSGRAGYGTVTGSIVINGAQGGGCTIKELRAVTGFVPQDDVMDRNMTVEENVRFQAELRLPRGDAQGILERGEQVQHEAEQVLGDLGLGDPALRGTLIGDENVKGVSGGQRKRVSIAMELVSRPWLLFLDEPTSGLDSTTSHSVVGMFTAAARSSGCTTIAVVHQPRYETLCLFDQLVLLAAGGFLVYSGPASAVEEYLHGTLRVRFPEKANPADTLLDAVTWESARDLMGRDEMLHCGDDALVTRKAFGEWLARVWRASTRPGEERAADVPLPPLEVATCSWGEEVFVHMKRAAVQFQRDWVSVAANTLLMLLALVAYCVCAPQSEPTQQLEHPLLALFILMLTQGVAAQRVFGGNGRSVVCREAGCRVSTALCFVGRDVAALAEMLLAAAIFTAAYYALGPLLSSHHTLFWVAFAQIYATFGLGYICSVLLEADSAQMMAVVSSFLAFLLSGVEPSFADMAGLFKHSGFGLNLMALSPLRWAFGYLMFDHVIMKQSVFNNPMVEYLAKGKLESLAMPIAYIKESGWTCDGSDNCKQRWTGDTEHGIPMISFVCSTWQLILLGIYFRAVALLCMMVSAQLKAQGGGSLFRGAADRDSDAHGHGQSQESCCWVWPKGIILRDMLFCFALFVTDFEMCILLLTK